MDEDSLSYDDIETITSEASTYFQKHRLTAVNERIQKYDQILKDNKINIKHLEILVNLIEDNEASRLIRDSPLF